MHLPWPLQPLFFVQDFLGGLYAAIGMLFYWIMPYSHSHSLSVLWAFLGGLYAAIGMLFYWIMPYSRSHSHIPTPTLIWLGFLHPLSTRHLIRLPIPHQQVCKCFAHIKCLWHQHMTLAWFALSPLLVDHEVDDFGDV